MFITAPGLVQHLHPTRVAPRQTHWPAITLAREWPWYLLVHRVVCARGLSQSQTSLVGRDDTLRDLLDNLSMADITGVARLDRRSGAGPVWALQWISALWAPAPGERAQLGPLLLQWGNGALLGACDLRPVPGDAPGRRLLYAAAPSVAPP